MLLIFEGGTHALATQTKHEGSQAQFRFGGIVLAGTGAYGDDAQSTWTTYLYQGPGSHYSVIDEVPQGTHFDVKACAAHWCFVSYGGRDGYVQAETVSGSAQSPQTAQVLPQPAAHVVPNPAGPCFKANQTGGNGGDAMTVFCRTK